jgi:two-component system chemotaxis sensor kinase CheA
MDASIEEFLVETKEGLKSLDYNLRMLEQNPADRERIGKIFRAVHTIKTDCSYLNLERIESLAYAVEQVFYKMREENIGLTPKILQAVFAALTKIKSLAENLEHNSYDTTGHEDELIASLSTCTVMDILEIKALFVEDDAAEMPPSATGEAENNLAEAETSAQLSEETQALPPPAPLIPPNTKPISLEMLEILMQQAEELVQTRNQFMQIIRTSKNNDFDSPLQRLNTITSTLQEIAIKTRVISVNKALADIAQSSGKNINYTDDGSGTEIDEKLMQTIDESLTAIIAQSELPEIKLDSYNTAGYLIIEISGDDISQIQPDETIQNNITGIGGTIECANSAISIRVPLITPIMRILHVGIADRKLAIPQVNVLEIVRINSDSGLFIETINGKPVLQLRKKILPLVALSAAISMGDPDENSARYVVACEIGNYQFGVITEHVFSCEEIVVKPVPETLKNEAIYSGTAILGDDSLTLILNIENLARRNGDFTYQHKNEKAETNDTSVDVERFIIFKAGEGTPKIAPMLAISKLMEINAAEIDTSSGTPFIKYNDEPTQLIKINDEYQLSQSGQQPVLVISRDNKNIGLAVEEVLSIAKCPANIEPTTKTGFLGSMVVNEQSCYVIDVNYYFDKILGSSSEETPPSDDAQKTLLLIDDSQFFRKFLSAGLKSSGYNVVTCASAQEAFEKLKTEKFDVIVTDIEMPEMDGNQFTNLCKQNPALANVPFIALCPDNSDHTSYATADFTARVDKTSHNELIAALDTVFAVVVA